MVPQGAMNSLNPVMRIGDQILDGMRTHENGKSGPEHGGAATGAAGHGRPPAARAAAAIRTSSAAA